MIIVDPTRLIAADHHERLREAAARHAARVAEQTPSPRRGRPSRRLHLPRLLARHA